MCCWIWWFHFSRLNVSSDSGKAENVHTIYDVRQYAGQNASNLMFYMPFTNLFINCNFKGNIIVIFFQPAEIMTMMYFHYAYQRTSVSVIYKCFWFAHQGMPTFLISGICEYTEPTSAKFLLGLFCNSGLFVY